MKRLLALWLMLALSLAGCSRSQPFVWPDFCEKQHRTIPAEERFRDVLLDLLKKRETYDRRFAGTGGVDFFAYLDRSRRQHPMSSDAAIATQYVTDHPECCSQQTPSYLREHWIDDAYIDGGAWSADVRVWRLPTMDKRALPKGKMPDQFVRITDACDDNIRYEVLDGIPE